MSDPVDPLTELIRQIPAILLALGVLLVPLTALLMSVLTFRRQGKTDAKVAQIEHHANGMRAALEKSAYDRGAADEKVGEAKPKAEAP